MNPLLLIAIIVGGIGALYLASRQHSPSEPRTGAWGQIDRLERIEALQKQRGELDREIGRLWSEYEREEKRNESSNHMRI